MTEIRFSPIGVIHSPFTDLSGMPIQPTGARDVSGTVEVAPAFTEALDDLDGFSHIFLLYHFHLSKPWKPKVKPFLDNNVRGLFSTRAPSRPNPIGLSVVRLVEVKKNILSIKDVDILDGTPLLDIKPFVSRFDGACPDAEGWLSEKAGNARSQKSDSRFVGR